MVTNRLGLNVCFAQLIWANLPMQDETVTEMCLSNQSGVKSYIEIFDGLWWH